MKTKNKKTLGVLIILLILLIEAGFFFFLIKSEPERDCDSYSLSECPARCIICPPCAVCSSVNCQTKEFCENLGFNETW
jgi:hypothetical protein